VYSRGALLKERAFLFLVLRGGPIPLTRYWKVWKSKKGKGKGKGKGGSILELSTVHTLLPLASVIVFDQTITLIFYDDWRSGVLVLITTSFLLC